ncbi:MAG: SMC-Scp complex subunit ScpB [Endomicrobiia bacterium]|nr:SMC-Scp complex subunit ScpB [Endomicrobiia bacterium]
MEFKELVNIVEVLLFITDRPLSLRKIKEIAGDDISDDELRAALAEIIKRLAEAGSPLEIREVAGGWQFATRAAYAPWVKKLYRDKTRLKLSQSALETLSIIAYRQPITRLEIERVRGIESLGVSETLLERKLIKIVGRKETLGRPLLYGTTQEFLKYFGLQHLSELPTIEDFSVPPSDESSESVSSSDDAADEGAEVPPEESPS